MSLTTEEIEKVAHLARLHIDEAELPAHVKNLSKILNLVEQMNQADTTHVLPMAHPLDIEQPLRQDKITETNQRELFQKIAPNVEKGLYLVPQVIE